MEIMSAREAADKSGNLTKASGCSLLGEQNSKCRNDRQYVGNAFKCKKAY